MSYPTSRRFKSKSKSKNETNPTMSTLATNDISYQTVPSRSGMCNLTVNQSLLTTIIKLTQDSSINIVELQLFVGFHEKGSRLFPDVTWVWANKVGREIMSILSMKTVLDIETIRTLTVGRKKLAVQIYENPLGCIPSKKNGTSFVAKTLLQKLFRTSNTEYQMCYGTKKKVEIGLLETEYTCCKIIRKGEERQCYVYSSNLTDILNHYFNYYGLVLMQIVCPLLFCMFYEFSREKKYYKITDSPMSLSSIIYSVFFEGHGPVKDFISKLIFIGPVVYARLHFFAPSFVFSNFMFIDLPLVYWALAFPFSDVFKENETTQTKIKRLLSMRTKCYSLFTKYLQKYGGYDAGNVFLSGDDYQSTVNVLTLLFDFKRWQKTLKNFFKVRSIPRDLECHKETLEYVKMFFRYYKALLCCLLYVVVVFAILSLLILLKVEFYSIFFAFFVLNVRRRNCLQYCRDIVHILILAFSLFFIVFSFLSYVPFIILLLIAGLILNAIYFIPYVIFTSVFIFYSWTFWKNVETKYFSLKMQICEVCKESIMFGPDDRGGCDDVDDDNNSGIIWWGGNIQNINSHFDGHHHISDDFVRFNNAGHNNGNDGDGNDDDDADSDGNDGDSDGNDGDCNDDDDGDDDDGDGNGNGNDGDGNDGNDDDGNDGNDGDDDGNDDDDGDDDDGNDGDDDDDDGDGNGNGNGNDGNYNDDDGNGNEGDDDGDGNDSDSDGNDDDGSDGNDDDDDGNDGDDGGNDDDGDGDGNDGNDDDGNDGDDDDGNDDGDGDGNGNDGDDEDGNDDDGDDDDGDGNDGDDDDGDGNDGDGNDGNVGDGNDGDDDDGNDVDGNDDDGNDGDGNDDNNDSNRLGIIPKWKYNRNNQLIISKQFYDSIREKILPYNLTLFHFFIKVLFVFLFAYFMFTVINILQTTDFSGTVKVVSTMSVSAVPYIFNVMAAKISEEEEKAQNEVQKIKVKKLVSELTEGTDQVHQIYMKMSDDEI